MTRTSIRRFKELPCSPFTHPTCVVLVGMEWRMPRTEGHPRMSGLLGWRPGNLLVFPAASKHMQNAHDSCLRSKILALTCLEMYHPRVRNIWLVNHTHLCWSTICLQRGLFIIQRCCRQKKHAILQRAPDTSDQQIPRAGHLSSLPPSYNPSHSRCVVLHQGAAQPSWLSPLAL